jgi:DNA helicase II / ATP-dependent DNA helicase PcrA
MANKFTYDQIVEILKKSGASVHTPTPEQREIIESTHFGPALIVAGAGSGKTETMSARVLWLVANGFANPDEILGLTFTRKAAGELSHRIRTRLRQMNLLGSATVSTYHSYAGKVLAEHGIRLGIDTDSDPIGEAAAWQIANKIINNFESEIAEIVHAPKTVVNKVLDLVDQLGEHGKDLKELEQVSNKWLEKFATVTNGSNEGVRRAISTLRERLALAPMIERFNQVRLENGQLTFGDQMSLAAKLVNSEFRSDIASAERAKYKFVLLDEYQDTSYSQVRFLTGLFGAESTLGTHSVTAVGDPNQSIYGWRSASAGTISAFPREFGAPKECKNFTLRTTWRNDAAILKLANRTVAELNQLATQEARFANVARAMSSVTELQPRPNAGQGEIVVGQYESMQSEAQAIASYFATAWNSPEREQLPVTERSTFAVLVRSKKYIPEIEQALRQCNIPVEVVGLGGLIHIPEVADLIALLRTLINPDAGSSLMRILVGPHLALGPKDLHGLGRYLSDIARANATSPSKAFADVLDSGKSSILEADDFAVGSAIEAIDNFTAAPKGYFSEVGYSRLLRFSKELADLRRRINGSITDALLEAEKYLYLDSEVLLHIHSRTGRKHLDQFLDEAAKFERTGGTLNMFLEWLQIADDEESGIKVSSVDVTTEAVQILTIHAAKGLEWNYVAVPGLVTRDFPASGKEGTAWTRNVGELPIEMRGDRASLIDFTFPVESTKASVVNKSLEEFENDIKKLRLFEEYRLAYVAFTRAKTNLMCSASWFGQGVEARDPSELFQMVYEFALANPEFAKIASEIEKPESENPIIDNPRTGVWPQEPQRALVVQASAKFVEGVPAISIAELAQLNGEVFSDALALIKEAADRKNKIEIAMPNRISVSTLVNLKKDPSTTALNLRRPVPNHIDKYARRGTQFHLWVEKYFKNSELINDEALYPAPAVDESTEDFPLKELQEKWLASEWAEAGRIPVAGGIEVPFETVISGVLLRGRIDAVYKDGENYTVVDWKTGRVKSGDDLEVAAIQLAMYRLAYAKLYGIPVEKISGAFHYVGYNETVRPTDLLSAQELAEIITSNLAP